MADFKPTPDPEQLGRKKYVAVAGNIGAGKSSLTRLLKPAVDADGRRVPKALQRLRTHWTSEVRHCTS